MSAEGKRKNGSKPTRNGCRTCRIRKVKCDEAKPACHRCVSTGRICDGDIGTAFVSTSGRRALRSALTTAFTRHESVSALFSECNPSSHDTVIGVPVLHQSIPIWQSINPTDLTDHEKHGFQHFQHLTAPVLQFMLPSPEWIPLALQLSTQEPAVFHAITATGTMARALTVLMHPSFPRPVLADMADEAARQYGKAIRVLRRYVDTAVSSTSVAREAILLACLLCVCFEAFRGRRSAAVEHARSGWGVARDGGNGERSASVRFFDEVFGKGEGVEVLFDEREHHDADCCSTDVPMGLSATTVFGSLQEAGHHLSTLAKAGEHFRSELISLAQTQIRRIHLDGGMLEGMRFCLAACLSRTVAIDSLQQSRLGQVQRAHKHWQNAFTTYLARQMLTQQDPNALEDSRHHLALRIRYFYSTFTLATCRETRELLTGRFADSFSETLECIERYLRLCPNQDQATAFYGIPLLPTLTLITHKCRSPTLRRRALALLSAVHKREGLEDSETLAWYARAVVEIEEMRGGVVPGSVPEEARFADVVVVGAGERGVFKVLGARFMFEEGENGGIEVVEYEGGAVPLREVGVWRIDV